MEISAMLGLVAFVHKGRVVGNKTHEIEGLPESIIGLGGEPDGLLFEDGRPSPNYFQ